MNKKMLISIALIFVMLLNYVVPFSLAYDEATSDIEITFNGNLYAAIKKNLVDAGIDASEYNDAQRTMKISQSAIDSVTSFNLSNSGISDLTGLDTFKNVTSLDLSANELDSNSNLEVLNSLNLKFLDLSSNKLSDVSMITNISTIQTLNLHNQKFNIIQIVEIDEETESDQLVEATYDLPQILSYGGLLKPEWLPETKYQNGSNPAPYVNWKKFDGKKITITTGSKSESNYTPYYGMTKVGVEVTDSTNTLYNSKINLYYITVSSDERGIIFKDENLYKAVKEQLTKAQTVNTDLSKYTDKGNLYERAYDEPLVLVVSINDLINKIPSLKLVDRKIKDLTGLEMFVGLEKELNLEGNYIEDIEKIIELKRKKLEEQEKLRAKVQKQIAYIKESVDAIEEAKKNVESETKKVTTLVTEEQTLKTEISKLEDEINTLNTETTTLNNNLPTYKTTLENAKATLTNKQEELKTLSNDLITLNNNLSKASTTDEKDKIKAQIEAKKAEKEAKQIEVDQAKDAVTTAEKQVTDTEAKIKSNTEAVTSKTKDLNSKKTDLSKKSNSISESYQVIANNNNTADTHREYLKAKLARLYEIYKKSYKLARLATVQLSTLTDEEFENLTYENAKSIFEAQTSRLADIENNLAAYESSYVIKEFNIPTVSNVTVNGDTEGTSSTKTVAIENPIATYFKEYAKNHEDWKLSDIKGFLLKVRYMSTVLEMMNYCTIERLYNGTTTCYAEEYLNSEIATKTWNGESTSDLTKIKSNLNTIKSTFADTYKHQCTGAVSYDGNNDIYALAKKYSTATSEEINAYVTIPMLKVLNVRRNLIESIDGIEELDELQELYAGNNELVNIESVDWTKMVNLKKLDLSYNSISEIKCLEVLAKLEELDLSKNLIAGAFNFTISGMPKLKKLNMSYNAINDIEYLRTQLTFVARGEGFDDIASYLNAGKFDVRFYGQILSMNLDLVQMGRATYVDLPMIFRQAEELDNVRTSFGINSIFGNVTNDGKQALLDTSKIGEQTAQVSIVDTNALNPGICSGTFCTIKYTVTEKPVIPDDNNNTVDNNVTNNTIDNDITNNTVNNDTTNNTVNNDITNNTVDNNVTNNTVDNNVTNNTVDPSTLGYTVKGESVIGVSPKTTVKNFSTKLTEDFKVVVVVENDDGTTTVVDNYVGTGMIAVLYNSEDKPVAAYEIVVKGDVNGDGLANALDSNLIKAYRAEITDLTGPYKEAADINQDGKVDAIDSRLLLYHRAEINGYIL